MRRTLPYPCTLLPLLTRVHIIKQGEFVDVPRARVRYDFEQHLREIGLETERELAADQRTVYVKIHTPFDVLCRQVCMGDNRNESPLKAVYALPVYRSVKVSERSLAPALRNIN